ncbi:MAG: hypothetical protein V4732_17360 [Pseudomonadota bacterium]
MPLEPTEIVEAVVLISGEKIVREMLYPEFEAILDGFVPVPDFKGSAAKAVYLGINANLCITSAVFFLLDFDGKGMVDRRWNIPLQYLAEVSGRGPDLGAGPIRLACFSQCAIEMQQNKLWDPQMEPSKNSFILLKKSVQNNRLGLEFKAPLVEKPQPSVAAPVNAIHQQAIKKKLHEHYSQELRDRLAGSLKEQRLRIATLQSKQQENINKLQHEHQQRLQVYQERLQTLEAQNSELNSRNQSLKENLDIQASKAEGVREYFTHKLKTAQLDENSQIQAMQENFNLEVELKIQAATAELREMLDMREVELFYRHQNESNLKEEITKLKLESHALLNNSGEQLLTRLNKAGVNFVVYHPGVGQFTIALDDLSSYLESSVAFVAKKSGVGEALYSQWFTHYQNPICNGTDGHGNSCGKSLVRIGAPLEFHEGESDRCEHHQAVSYKMVAEKR